MSRFVIEPHFRLQEWVAEEKGYFRQEGLEYEFREFVRSTDGAHHQTAGKAGAFQTIEKGRESNVTCACHWTVNVAASRGHTRLYADAYSVAPAAIFVPANSSVGTPADLAGVPISVGYQSGSHYSTIQALEQYMPSDRIELSFEEGMLFRRMEALLDGTAQAVALFSGPYYFAEQLGFRKIIDTTFMIAAMINGDPDREDIRRYFRALRRAQRDIDLRHDLYTHYYRNEFPDRLHHRMDIRRWGPGERIVFEPYSQEAFEQSFDWISRHAIFETGKMGSGRYDAAVISLAAE
jgi:ABC-type nitrate/sulfonate/bicarbonate transport system substrate-binding protein